MICFIYVLILLLSFTNIHSQSVNSDNNDKWKLGGYHPFPEMSRFLNSDLHVHYQPTTKASATRSSYSLLEYICRIANENEHIEEILLIFGEHYRSVIKTIIKQDCPNNNNNPKRSKRTTININQNNYPRVLIHKYHRRTSTRQID